MPDRAQGPKYQLSVAAYLASLLSKDPNVEDYRLFFEVETLNPFDDIVMAVKYHGLTYFQLYLVQVKSKDPPDIHKYLKGYNKITQQRLWNILGNIGQLSVDIQCWHFTWSDLDSIIFLGNIELEIQPRRYYNDPIRSVVNENFHRVFSKISWIYKRDKKFFDNFHILKKQLNKNQIADELKRIWSLSDVAQIIQFLDNYFPERKRDDLSLSKADFERELLRMRLSTYIVPPVKVTTFKKESACAWNELTLSCKVTIVQSELHIETCLFGCMLEKMCGIISINEWNECVDNEGKLTEDVKSRISSEMFKPQTLKDVVIYSWASHKIPLILKTENALPALKEFAHLEQHYIIIDPNPDERYNEINSYKLSVIKNLGGMQVDQLLQSILVSMQGREPASLYTIIDHRESLIESLTCLDILRLMEPRQAYLKEECLDGHNYLIFIIESMNPKPNEDNCLPTGDNIIKYCHPNDSDKCYQEMRKDPTFKSYRIYRLQTKEAKDRKKSAKLTIKYEEADTNDGKSYEAHKGLEHFLVDQYGESVYKINENHAVPIIGEKINMSYLKYIPRHVRKGIIKEEGKNNFVDVKITDPIIEYSQSPFLENDFFKQTTTKICVVTGEPGMGKTTFLQSLIQISDHQHYVLFCDLGHYQSKMNDDSKKLFKLCKDPLNFLCTKHRSSLCDNFLTALRKDRTKLIIILDSFDEIVATCKQNALNLIEKLNNNPNLPKIIIGSRLLTVNLLCNKFNADVLKIEGFCNERNKNYLDYWGFDNNSMQAIPIEFQQNPLYLNFLRTIVVNGKEIKNLTRWTLYKEIVDLKLDRYCQHHCSDKTEKESILDYHHTLALKGIFGVRIPIDLPSQKQKYTNYARIGLIKSFDEYGMPVFVHYTFLEYLVSQWLIKTSTSDKEKATRIYKHMLEFNMLDILRMHCEHLPLHRAVLNDDLKEVQDLCQNNKELLTEVDGIGRSALHLVAAANNLQIYLAIPIIQHTTANNLNLYPRDKLLDWTWIDYCDKDASALHHNNNFLYYPVVDQEEYWRYHVSQIPTEKHWRFEDYQQVYRYLRTFLQ